jgi:glutamate-1-semialdehyde 2,1-aminomutase
MQNTKKSDALFESSKRLVPGGVHSPVRAFRGVGGTPRFIESARGAELTDVDGNRYVDFCMSWGPLLFGHQDPEVLEAVEKALYRGWSYGTAEPYSLELAEIITGTLSWVEKIRFVNSGTEAVMAALRVARAATGRNKILKFDGCYHGHVDSMLVRAGSGLAEMASPDSAGVSKKVAEDTLVCPLNDIPAVESIFAQYGDEIAAIIVEPVPANNGLLLQKENFLSELVRIAHSKKALIIFDEVITGFRVAFGGMAERSGLKPDLVCYGKVIGGGFPVGAYGGRRDLMDLVAPAGPVYQAGTLSANPVAMSAGVAMLKKLRRDNPYAALESKVKKLGREFEAVMKKHDFPGRVQSYASLFWPILGVNAPVSSIEQIPADQKTLYAQIFHSLLESGFYFAPSGYEVCFLSTVHRDEDLARLVESFDHALSGLAGAKRHS